MTCTIVISHYHSLNFLRTCIRQIRRYANPKVQQDIIIVDQSKDTVYGPMLLEFNQPDIRIVRTDPLYSGYGIDFLFRYIDITSEYICQLHVDAFPIHRNWLYLPITLIQENDFSFVGQLQFYSRDTDTIYPKGPFFAMAQCFNVAKTSTYRELSMEAGFTRYHNRKLADFKFRNSDWEEWATPDYWNRGSDDDVVAFSWEDRNREHNKLGLAITGVMGTGDEPGYGRIIEDIVFHFGFARESIGVKEHMGYKYNVLTNRINDDFSDRLIDEMLDISRSNTPPIHESGTLERNFWDGRLKQISHPTKRLNNRIEELKHALD